MNQENPHPLAAPDAAPSDAPWSGPLDGAMSDNDGGAGAGAAPSEPSRALSVSLYSFAAVETQLARAQSNAGADDASEVKRCAALHRLLGDESGGDRALIVADPQTIERTLADDPWFSSGLLLPSEIHAWQIRLGHVPTPSP